MIAQFDIRYFANHLNQATLLCKKREKIAYFANEIALRYYGDEHGIVDVSALLENNTTHSFLVQTLKEELVTKGFYSASGLGTITNSGEEVICDLQITYTNEEKTDVLIMLVQERDKRLEIAKSQVDTSHRAEAILEFDENLTIYHCNPEFYAMLGASNDRALDLINHELSNTFRRDKRLPQVKEIRRGLQRNKVYHTEVEIINLSGDKCWYSLDLQRRSLDNGCEKLMCSMVNIDENVKANTKLSSLSQYFDSMQSLSGESMYVIDVNTRILKQKGKVAEELGIPPEVHNYPESAYNLMHPTDLEEFKVFANNSLNGKQSSCKVRVLTAEGDYCWYELYSMVIRDDKGEVKEVLGKMNNIDKEQQMETEFTLLNQYFNVMQELSDDILYRVDVKTSTLFHTMESVYFSRYGKEIPNYLQFFHEEKIIHPDDWELYMKAQEEWMNDEREETTVRATILTEEYEWYTFTGKKIFDEQGNLTEIFGSVRNVQKQKDLERRATHDLMTNVLNKVSFENEVIDVLKLSDPQEKHALVFIDLDDFKGVNDTLGHAFGDSLLISVGKRLKSALRESDLVGRLGGDEFAVLIKSIEDETSALTKTNSLLDSLQREFSFEGNQREIKASLGIALYPDHGKTYKDLIEKSDLALYSSKGKGKNVATVYSEEIEEY